MEKTIDEIKDSVINTIRPQRKDDDWIDERDVIEWINDQRNEFAKQQLDKNPLSMPDRFLQNETVKMKSMSLPGVNDIYVATSTDKVPSILDIRGSDPAINMISGDQLIGALAYKFVPSNSIMSYLYGSRKFNQESLYVTIENGYLILASTGNHIVGGIRDVKIQAVFENPLEISTFNRETDIYPLPGNLRPMLERKVISEKFGLEIQNYSDQDNNASHELKSDMNAS